MSKGKLIVIQGPTACGKSALAEELVGEFNGEIISADSRQVYRYLDIGTAKPGKEILERIDYHLIDIVNPDEEYNAGLFARDAREIINDIEKRGRTPFIVGGTGFYIKALLQGLAPIPKISFNAKKRVEEFIQNSTIEAVYEHLRKIDETAAARIKKNDLHRQQRALEVYESTGKPLSWFWEQHQGIIQYSSFNILLTDEREKLYERINSRIDKMLEKGLVNEIRELLAKGYQEDDPGMISVGYREFYPWLNGEISYQEAVDLAKQHSRNYAKRQITWYRRQEFDLTLSVNDLNLYVLRSETEKYIDKRSDKW